MDSKVGEDTEASQLDKQIGSMVKKTRHNQKLTQRELADMLGVRYQQIQKYESGANRIAASRLWEIARALDKPIETFYLEIQYSQANIACENFADIEEVWRIFEKLTDERVRAEFFRFLRSLTSTQACN